MEQILLCKVSFQYFCSIVLYFKLLFSVERKVTEIIVFKAPILLLHINRANILDY